MPAEILPFVPNPSSLRPTARLARLCPDCHGSRVAFFPGELRACDTCVPPASVAGLKITDALAIWPHIYPMEVPFNGATGDARLDARLVAAFRALQGATLDQRLAFLERETWVATDEPGFRAADPYRAKLMRWWLDLYEEAREA